MKIEYGILKASKNIEDELNNLAKKGWRVKCSVGKKLVLQRKIKIMEEEE